MANLFQAWDEDIQALGAAKASDDQIEARRQQLAEHFKAKAKAAGLSSKKIYETLDQFDSYSRQKTTAQDDQLTPEEREMAQRVKDGTVGAGAIKEVGKRFKDVGLGALSSLTRMGGDVAQTVADVGENDKSELSSQVAQGLYNATDDIRSNYSEGTKQAKKDFWSPAGLTMGVAENLGQIAGSATVFGAAGKLAAARKFSRGATLLTAGAVGAPLAYSQGYGQGKENSLDEINKTSNAQLWENVKAEAKAYDDAGGEGEVPYLVKQFKEAGGDLNLMKDLMAENAGNVTGLMTVGTEPLAMGVGSLMSRGAAIGGTGARAGLVNSMNNQGMSNELARRIAAGGSAGIASQVGKIAAVQGMRGTGQEGIQEGGEGYIAKTEGSLAAGRKGELTGEDWRGEHGIIQQGLQGAAIGGIMAGGSVYSSARNASKLALEKNGLPEKHDAAIIAKEQADAALVQAANIADANPKNMDAKKAYADAQDAAWVATNDLDQLTGKFNALYTPEEQAVIKAATMEGVAARKKVADDAAKAQKELDDADAKEQADIAVQQAEVIKAQRDEVVSRLLPILGDDVAVSNELAGLGLSEEDANTLLADAYKEAKVQKKTQKKAGQQTQSTPKTPLELAVDEAFDVNGSRNKAASQDIADKHKIQLKPLIDAISERIDSNTAKKKEAANESLAQKRQKEKQQADVLSDKQQLENTLADFAANNDHDSMVNFLRDYEPTEADKLIKNAYASVENKKKAEQDAIAATKQAEALKVKESEAKTQAEQKKIAFNNDMANLYAANPDRNPTKAELDSVGKKHGVKSPIELAQAWVKAKNEAKAAPKKKETLALPAPENVMVTDAQGDISVVNKNDVPKGLNNSYADAPTKISADLNINRDNIENQDTKPIIVRNDGKPFLTQEAAEQAIKNKSKKPRKKKEKTISKDTHEVIPVDGGFAIAPVVEIQQPKKPDDNEDGGVIADAPKPNAPVSPTGQQVVDTTLIQSIEGEYQHNKIESVKATVTKTDKGFDVDWGDEVQSFTGKNAQDKTLSALKSEDYAKQDQEAVVTPEPVPEPTTQKEAVHIENGLVEEVTHEVIRESLQTASKPAPTKQPETKKEPKSKIDFSEASVKLEDVLNKWESIKQGDVVITKSGKRVIAQADAKGKMSIRFKREDGGMSAASIAHVTGSNNAAHMLAKRLNNNSNDALTKKLIGKTPEGKDLYEDGRGVRFTDNGRGVQVGEDVAITMQDGKAVYDVSGRTDEHRTVEEVAARQPKPPLKATASKSEFNKTFGVDESKIDKIAKDFERKSQDNNEVTGYSDKHPSWATKTDSAIIEIDDEIRAAAKELADLLKGFGKGTLNSGVDPIAMSKVLLVGGKLSLLYLSKGVVKFSAWAKNIIDVLSSNGVAQDAIEPHLRGLYLASKANTSPEIRKQMDKEDDVYDFDFATLNKSEDETNKLGNDRLVFKDLESAKKWIALNANGKKTPVSLGQIWGNDDSVYYFENKKEWESDTLDNTPLVFVNRDQIKLKDAQNELSQLDDTSTKPLEGVSANDVQGIGSQRSTGGKTSGGSGTNLSGNERTGGAGLSTTRIMGDDTGEVSDTARGKWTERLAVTPAQDIATDFVITDEDNIGGGGLKTKYRNNVAAIRVLKQVESEGREATNEEQKILAKWVGWGSLYQAFRYSDGSIAKGWDKEVKELAELLTPDEMTAAVDSSVAAHYTSPKVVEAMWKAVQQLGFKNGKVLEPSVGSGNFFGAMPTKLRNSALLHGVELDNITGGIAKLLYPKAKIKAAMGFQDYAIPDGYFDLVIGNPPFGKWPITDKTRRHLDGFSIHNYFFAKSIDALREGGVLAMVVTNRLMDASNANDKARQYIDEHAELLGAIRLPNNAFLKNAGTQVTTDIIFLRKRVAGEDITTNKWMNVRQYQDKNGKTVPLNEYFHAHPEMMLGEFGAYGSMYTPDDPALVARDGQDTLALLNDAIAKLPKSVMPTVEQKSEEMAEKTAKDIPDVKVGSMFVENGDIYIRQQDSLGERQADVVTLSGKAADRVKGMVNIRDAFILVRDAQLSPNKDSELPSLRKKLNVAYDNFVKTNGFINDDANKRLMRDDPSWPQLSALEEKYDKGLSAAVAKTTGEVVRPVSASKAAIFNVRTQFPYATITSVSSAKDGYVESLNRYGKLDIDFVANLYGQSVGDTITELGNLIYQDPVRGWVTSSDYLSGNVKLKLQAAKLSLKAQESAKGELESLPSVEQLHRGITALEAVIPEDIESVDIDIRAGAHWLPPKHIADFAREMLDIRGDVGATYNKFDASWSVDFNQNNLSAAKKTEWSTDRKTAAQILNAALNHKQLTVYDDDGSGVKTVNTEATAAANEKVAHLKRAWADWIWHDDNRRVELSRLYNDIFNTDAPTVFDGQHLTLAGKIDDDVLRLRPHQNDGIWRITQSDSTLLDHVVGAGKTFTMIGGAMELRRMGKSNKPMFVVPNHLVGQWAADFIKLYPSANILAATKADFEAKNRKKLFARIATGDWDAVIVAHSSFGKVSLHPDEEAKFIKKEIEEMMEAEALARKEGGEKARNAKDIGKRRLAKEDKLKKLLATKNKDDDNVYWSELGVDSLFVDEAHEFKNLAFTSTIQRVAGLGNQAGSQKATDLFTKIVSLKDRVAGAKVVFATGTPISNTMAEMYTMQRYLDLERMVHQGTVLFDAWARTFGEVVSDWELSPAGKYKMNSRFAKFVNMPELMQGYLSFADVINRDDINRQLAARGETLGTPKIRTGKPQNIVVDRSQDQADYIGEASIDSNGNESYPKGSLVYRAENIPKKQEKGADNMLKIMSDARKAALDMRLIDPSLSDSPKSKVNEAIRRILTTYRQWNDDKGVQLVFCDLSTPKGAIAQEKARIEELVRLADEGDEAAIKELDEMSPDELDALNSSFSVYDDMKAKLIAQGIPANQVAFIHDAKTDIQKEALFGKVRSGQIRVLIGSTAKMGAGMNVQDKLVALHHLDAPWRPSDLEQREGRIIRQKNEFYKRDPEGFEVDIMRYATKQTLDSRMWQTLEGKARFIEQIRKGDIKSRSVEDIGGEAANAAEMKAASSGNPLILEEMTLRREVQNLEAEKQRHVREQHRLKSTAKKLQEDNVYLEQQISKMEVDAKSKTPEEFEMTVGRKTFKQGEEKARERAGKALSDAAKDIYIKDESRVVGKFGDFDIVARLSYFGSTTFRVKTKSGLSYGEFSFDAEKDSMSGLTLKIANIANSIEGLLGSNKRTIENNNKEIPKVQALLSNWKDSAKLDEARKKHAEIIDQLKPKEKVKVDEVKSDDQTKPIKPKFSRGEGSGLTTTQTRAILNERFGEKLIKALEAKGLITIMDSPPSWAKPDADGAYYNGKAYLFTDNLSAETVVATFVHELGGHKGFQELMTPTAYDSLMRQFNRLVNQGNPIALAAKARAEAAESTIGAQQDEYLPYLLTQQTTLNAGRIQQSAAAKVVEQVYRAVKAWLYRTLSAHGFDGVASKLLQPKDITLLAERMIREMGNGTNPSNNTKAKGSQFSQLNTPQTQINAVRRKYEGTSQWMKAPNGQPTKLNEMQWLQVRTPNFKAWFGDFENDAKNASKVVDENGEPMVVYHGTEYGGFTEFGSSGYGAASREKGFWFSNKIRALEYSGKNQEIEIVPVLKSWSDAAYFAKKLDVEFKKAPEDEYDDGIYFIDDDIASTLNQARNILQKAIEDKQPAGIYPVFLSLKTPKTINAKGKLATNINTLVMSNVPKKYDGMMIVDVDDAGRFGDYGYITDNYVAKTSTQIKSAIGNNGEFSPTNPDIRFSRTEQKPRSASLDNFIAKAIAEKAWLTTEQINLLNSATTFDELIPLLDKVWNQYFEIKKLKNNNSTKTAVGVDNIKSLIRSEVDSGHITKEHGDLALYFAEKNPALFDSLKSFSFQNDAETLSGNAVGGVYNVVDKVIRISRRTNGSQLTIAHEVLHHAEEFLPENIKFSIIKAWQNDLIRAFKSAENGSNRKTMLHAIIHSIVMGDMSAIEKAIDSMDGVIPANTYHLFNPSEYWAENASRLMNNRSKRQDIWIENARSWINGLIQTLKNALGLQNDAAILKGLRMVLSGSQLKEGGNGIDTEHVYNMKMLNLFSYIGKFNHDGANKTKTSNEKYSRQSKNPITEGIKSAANDAKNSLPTPIAKSIDNFMAGRRLPSSDTANITAKTELSLYHRTISTQQNTALQYADFKKVYDMAQRYLQHVAVDAYAALKVAPNLLGKLESWNDLKKDVKKIWPATFIKQKADRAAVASVIFDETLNNELLSDADILKALTREQRQIYKEARDAIQVSLENTAKSEMVRKLLAAEAINWSTVESMINQDLPVNQFAQTVRDMVESRIGGLSNELEAILDSDKLVKKAFKSGKVFDQDVLSKAQRTELKKALTLKAQIETTEEALKSLNDVEKRLDTLIEQGYAPLMRFGEYTLTVRDLDGKVKSFFMFESKAEQVRATNAIVARYGKTVNLETDMISKEEFKQFAGMTPETMALFAKETGMDKDAAYQHYLKLAIPARSAMTRMIKRKGTAGFSDDIQRVVASFVMSNARMSAKNIYAAQIEKAVQAIESGKSVKDQAIIMKDNVFNPKENSAQLRNILFLWNLGGSLFFGLLNMTQPYMQTLPHLSQYVPIKDAFNAIIKGSGIAGSAMKNGTAPKGYEAEYNRAVREGVVDPQNVFMLSGVERGKTGVSNSAWGVFTHTMGLIAQVTESFNRKAVFIASLQVAKQKGDVWLKKKGFNSAYDFAKDSVDQTQGVYDKANRSNWANTSVGAPLMVFKQFSINYVEQVVRMWKKEAASGDEGKKAVFLMLAMLASLSGMTGLPFIKDFLDVSETTAAYLGHPVNLEREARLMLGKDVADPLLNGVLNHFVFNQMGVDVQSRTGMGDLVPLSNALNPTLSAQGRINEFASIAGATGGLIEKGYDATQLLARGNLGTAALTLMPRSFTSAFTGGKMAVTDEVMDSKGNKLFDTTWSEGFTKAIDGTPKRMADLSRTKSLEWKDFAIQDYMTTSFKQKIINAMMDKDQAEVNKLMKEVEVWNNARSRYPVYIDLNTLAENANKKDQTFDAREKIRKGMTWVKNERPEM